MARSIRQSVKDTQIDSLAEQIFIQMCATTHHGFDATHYVRKSYEFAQAFFQNRNETKLTSHASSTTKTAQEE